MKPLPLVLAGALGATLVLTAPPAMAQSVTSADRAGDVTGVPYVNLRALTVKHTKKTITINYSSESLGNNSGVEQLLLDTNAKRPGPELRLGFARYSESWVDPMRRGRVDRSKVARKKWSKTYAPKPGTCDATVRINSRWQRTFTPVTITIRKKKGCITGKAARVHLTTWTNGVYDLKQYRPWATTVRDDLPNGSRTFTRWVKQRSAKARPYRVRDGADRVNWWSDIRAVTANHQSTKLDLTVRHLAKPAASRGWVRTYLDTNADSRPDFEVHLGDGRAVTLTRMTAWNTYGAVVACGSLTGTGPTTGSKTSSFSLPTECIGSPASVRIAVTSTDTNVDSRNRPIDGWGAIRGWSSAISRG